MKRAREEEEGADKHDRGTKRMRRASLPPEIQALPHVMKRVDEFLLPVENVAMKAAATGDVEWLKTVLPKINDRNIAVDIGAARGHSAVIEAVDHVVVPNHKALTNAIEGGHVDALRCLLPRYDNWRDFQDALVLAMKAKQQVMVEMIAEAICECIEDDEFAGGCAFGWAARKGILEVVKVLHGSQHPVAVFDAMLSAAKNGHLNVVKFMHENRVDICDEVGRDTIYSDNLSLIVLAAGNGHLDVVKYLFDNEGYGKTSELDEAFTCAAGNGHLEIVVFLFNDNDTLVLDNAFRNAVDGDQLEVVKFLYDNEGGREITEAEDDGTQWDALLGDACLERQKHHLKIVKLLSSPEEEGKLDLLNDALLEAASNGDLSVVRLLFANGVDPFH